MPKSFLDIAVESDRKTKLHVLFNFEEDNKRELKIDRVPGQRMTIEAVIDGQKWTGVGTLNQNEMKLNLKVCGVSMSPRCMSPEMLMALWMPSGPCKRISPWEKLLSSTRTRTSLSCS